MMTDPIADLLARIRNAGMARHQDLSCPSSKLKLAVSRVLQEHGYVENVHVVAEGGHPTLRIALRYQGDGQPMIEGLRRVSRPSRRVYVGKDKVKKVRNGLGLSVLSTSRGILSDQDAREAEVGGEVLCEVW